MKDQVNAAAAVKQFWILDGYEKTFFKKEEIKRAGGKFDRDFEAWCIDSPDAETLESLLALGLKVQFRRYKEKK